MENKGYRMHAVPRTRNTNIFGIYSISLWLVMHACETRPELVTLQTLCHKQLLFIYIAHNMAFCVIRHTNEGRTK